MICSDLSKLVPLHMTGELDSSQAAELAAHLEGCRVCAEDLRAQKRLDAELRAALSAERVETGALERRVLQKIEVEARSQRRTWQLAFAATAFVVVLVAVLGHRALTHRSLTEPAATGVYAAAARDHRFEIVERQPRKWRFDGAAIAELAQMQGVPLSAISATAPAGYRLQEGKLCKLGGNIFLHLVYTDGEKNFSLFLREEAGGATVGKSISSSESGAEHVAGFQDGLLRAVIVTDQPGDTALRFARIVAQSI